MNLNMIKDTLMSKNIIIIFGATHNKTYKRAIINTIYKSGICIIYPLKTITNIGYFLQYILLKQIQFIKEEMDIFFKLF